MTTNDRVVLTSWKEIAAYFGKGVRTVQRWERELGLPVRRPDAHNERIVIAVRGELDAWVRRQSRRAHPTGQAWQQALANIAEHQHKLLNILTALMAAILKTDLGVASTFVHNGDGAANSAIRQRNLQQARAAYDNVARWTLQLPISSDAQAGIQRDLDSLKSALTQLGNKT